MAERRQRIQDMLRNKVQTIARGAVVVEGRPFLVRNVRIDDELAKADLVATNGEKVGILELTSKDELLVQGTIQIDVGPNLGSYDIFIPLEHPNSTNLYNSVQAVKITDKADVVRAIKGSYNITATAISSKD